MALQPMCEHKKCLRCGSRNIGWWCTVSLGSNIGGAQCENCGLVLNVTGLSANNEEEEIRKAWNNYLRTLQKEYQKICRRKEEIEKLLDKRPK
jgi:transcription elongation factor Elf1